MKDIIWLEDKIELNNDFKEILSARSGYRLIHASNIIEFGNATMKNINSPENVAAFVLDVTSAEDSLAGLGIEAARTSCGNDTGAVIFMEYLRNINKESPIGDTFRLHDVLLLSTLSQSYMDGRYLSLLSYENKVGNGYLTLLSKTQGEGGEISRNCLAIQKWRDSI